MRIGICPAVGTLVALVTVLHASAASPARPSAAVGGRTGRAAALLQMTDEERIRTRLTLVTARPDRLKTSASGSGGSGFQELVDGEQHPEAFLRFELLDALLSGLSTDATRKTQARREYDTRLAALGYAPDEFWRRLQQATAPYLALRSSGKKTSHGQTVFTTPGGGFFPVVGGAGLCSARFDALQKAQQQFGASAFDEVLYGVVAPQLKHSSGGSWSPADHAAQLRFEARGCK